MGINYLKNMIVVCIWLIKIYEYFMVKKKEREDNIKNINVV